MKDYIFYAPCVGDMETTRRDAPIKICRKWIPIRMLQIMRKGWKGKPHILRLDWMGHGLLFRQVHPKAINPLAGATK